MKILLLLLFLPVFSFCQKDTADTHLSVKLSPLSLVGAYVGPCARVSLEHRIRNSWAVQYDVGIFFYNTRGTTIRTELRRYLNNEERTSGQYLSAELQYKYQQYTTPHQVENDTLDGDVYDIAPFNVSKNVECLTFKFGNSIRKFHFQFYLFSAAVDYLYTMSRYIRQTRLDGFGETGQQALSSGSVLVIGAGALGTPVLQYLAGAGVGRITIVDGDTIALSNLHRQVLYKTEDVGKFKAETARDRLLELNPEIELTAVNSFLTPELAHELIPQYDVVVDGTDNFPTRYLINDACVLLGKPNVHGSVVGFTGTVAVFNAPEKEGRSANYRDLFPSPPNAEDAPSCADAGIIGAVPGVIGSMQAVEVIKLLTGIGEPLTNCLYTLDFRTNANFRLNFGKDPANALNTATISLIFAFDYQAFCLANSQQIAMKSISVSELKSWMDNGETFQLIDVREPYENEICTLNGTLIPLAEIPASAAKIDRDKKVVIHCRSGKRSANAIDFLEQNLGFDNLYNLDGGILAWADEIEPTMEKY